MHEEVLNQLAKLSTLRVISRTSMLRYQETLKSILQIAAELRAYWAEYQCFFRILSSLSTALRLKLRTSNFDSGIKGLHKPRSRK